MLEDCGFMLRQSFISWIYKTGFPKAYDVSLGIDKKFIREEFIEEHHRKPTKKEMKLLLKEKRKIVGKGKGTSWNFQNKVNVEQDFRPSDYYEEKDGEFSITAPATDLAQKWQGWKSVTGLKPALECVLMVQKPLAEATIVDNVLRHGVGAINVDACRIPFQSQDDIGDTHRFKKAWSNKGSHEGWKRQAHEDYEQPIVGHQKGRFPANLIVSQGALDTGNITKSEGGKTTRKKEDKVGEWGFEDFHMQGYDDVGDQSRYFSLDAWAQHHGFLDVPKASKSERNEGLDDLYWLDGHLIDKATYVNLEKENESLPQNRRHKIAKGCIHPTVKPIKLMAYLIELGCPPNGIVIDPFLGSGTTCKAAAKLKRKWIGIDVKREYIHIAKPRIAVEYEGEIEIVMLEEMKIEKSQKREELKVDWQKIFKVN